MAKKEDYTKALGAEESVLYSREAIEGLQADKLRAEAELKRAHATIEENGKSLEAARAETKAEKERGKPAKEEIAALKGQLADIAVLVNHQGPTEALTDAVRAIVSRGETVEEATPVTVDEGESAKTT